MEPLAENEVLILPEYDEHGQPYYRLPNAKADRDQVAVCPKLAEKVIPVIFLPGVMGSNLRAKKGKDAVWFSNMPKSVDTAWEWLFKSAKDRKQLLDPENTEVDPEGKVLWEEAESPRFPTRRERGWGSAFYRSYGEALNTLQFMLNDEKILLNNLMTGAHRPTSRQLIIGQDLGAEKGEEPLTESEVRHSYHFLFPLHVFGYNWLQSNIESATYLGDYITRTLETYRGRLAVNKVILVTHSMGGLVARYYSENMGGQEKILGIVHGVMPDLGSPSAYRRMKVGEQAPGVGNVIGNSAEKLMPVLAQSPGPLQLLPGKAYGSGWLKIQQDEGYVSYPKSDPYREIYLNQTDWWRLYEADIAGGNVNAEWNKYEKIMTDKVILFIERLNGKYHPNSWAFYGASEKYPSDESLLWQSTAYYPDDPLVPYRQPVSTAPKSDYALHDILEIPLPATHRKDHQQGKQYRLVSSGGAGDGTVPVKAGRISWSGLRSLLATEVDHEGAYASNIQAGEETATPLLFTLRAIVKMVQPLAEPGVR